MYDGRDQPAHQLKVKLSFVHVFRNVYKRHLKVLVLFVHVFCNVYKRYLKRPRPLSKAFFVQCKLFWSSCLILLEKHFVEVWRQWIPLDAHRISPVTLGMITVQSFLCFSVRPTEFIFIVLPFYHVTCVPISKVVLTSSSFWEVLINKQHFQIEAHDIKGLASLIKTMIKLKINVKKY